MKQSKHSYKVLHVASESALHSGMIQYMASADLNETLDITD